MTTHEIAVRLPMQLPNIEPEKYAHPERFPELLAWLEANRALKEGDIGNDLRLEIQDLTAVFYALVSYPGNVPMEYKAYTYKDVSGYTVCHIAVLDDVLVSQSNTPPDFRAYNIRQSFYTIVNRGEGAYLEVQKGVRWLADEGLHNPRSRFKLSHICQVSSRFDEINILAQQEKNT